MLPTKCVLGVIDMVLGDLETVGRNWTLRASLQRWVIKAIVFHISPLHREDTSLNSFTASQNSIKLRVKSLNSKASCA